MSGRTEAVESGTREEMSLDVEDVVNGGVDGDKALGRAGRLEALHLALSSSYHLVGVVGPIVLAKSLFMVARQPDVVEGSAVGAQLIGYHHLWREALFSHQLESCTPV